MFQVNEEVRHNNNTTWAGAGRQIVRSIQTLGDTLLGKVGQIIRMNMLMYQDLCTRLANLDSSIQRPIAEEIFTFEDAIGRVVPVPLRLVDSWNAFDALLLVRFKGFQGFGRVARRRYVLQDHHRRRDIRRDIPWLSAMLPGSQISMSVICSRLLAGGSSLRTTCPTCSSNSVVATSKGNQW